MKNVKKSTRDNLFINEQPLNPLSEYWENLRMFAGEERGEKVKLQILMRL